MHSCGVHYMESSVQHDLELRMDGTGSGSCLMAGCGISGVEPSGSATRELVNWSISSLCTKDQRRRPQIGPDVIHLWYN
jgi:hypothetical protein